MPLEYRVSVDNSYDVYCNSIEQVNQLKKDYLVTDIKPQDGADKNEEDFYGHITVDYINFMR